MASNSTTSCSDLLRMLGTLICGHSQALPPAKPAVQHCANLRLATQVGDLEDTPAPDRVSSRVSFSETVQYVGAEEKRGKIQFPRLRSQRSRRMSAGSTGAKEQRPGILRGFKCLRPRSENRLAPVVEERGLLLLEEGTEGKRELPRLLGIERDDSLMKLSKTDSAVPQLEAQHVDGEEASGTPAPADDNVRGSWVPEEEPKTSFFERAQAMAPQEHRGREALTCLLENVDLEHVRRSLEVEGPEGLLRKYICEILDGCEISSTAWRDCDQVPGSRVRQFRFRMPLPTDAPDAVKRLVNIPDNTATTVMVRLQGDESRLVLNFETQTHDAPFGKNFWVADQLCFEARPGGVQLTKFSGLRWNKSLPWYAAIIGAVIDSKAFGAAPQTGESLGRIAQG